MLKHNYFIIISYDKKRDRNIVFVFYLIFCNFRIDINKNNLNNVRKSIIIILEYVM